MDLAASTVELDSSGFVFDKHQIALENLDSKNSKGIMKLVPTELKRRINFLGRTGRQIMFQMLSFFFNSNRTQGHTLNLNDIAPCRVVQRQPQDVQSDSERNIVSLLVRIRMKVYLENSIREASGKSLAS